MTLARLFGSLFTDIAELHRFLRDHVDSLAPGEGDPFVQGIAGADFTTWCDSAVVRLKAQGYHDHALRNALLGAYPRRRVDIERAWPIEARTRQPGFLYVHLQRTGARVRWRWGSQSGNILAHEGALPAIAPTSDLLLGPPELRQRLLLGACGRVVHAAGGASVRVQLHTTDPELLAVPWTTLRDGEDALVKDCGWTVELVGSDRPANHERLELPVGIDIVGGDAALRDSIVTVLERAWPQHWDRRAMLRTPAEVRAAPSPIRVVIGEVPTLPPVIVEATLTPEPGFFPSTPSVAHLVIAGTRARMAPAIIGWLRGVLVEGKDPAAAWQGDTGAVWSRYASFATNIRNRRPSQEQARRRLNRIHQRGQADLRVRYLVGDPGKRVLALFGSGTPGNLIEDLLAQVEDYAQQGSPYHLVLIDQIAPPKARPLTVDSIEEELRLSAAIQPGATLKTWLEGLRSRSPGTAPVVVLDLGVARKDAPIGEADVRALLEWARDRLCEQVPTGLRVALWLTAEVAGAQGPIDLKKLRREFNVPRLDAAVLDPLTPVDVDHIAEFLKEADSSSCPPDLVWDVAEGIYAATDGRFDSVVKIIEICEANGWFETIDRARSAGWKSIFEGADV